MPQAPLKLVKRCQEWIPQSEIGKLEPGIRGLYVLFRRRKSRRRPEPNFNVVYVGLAGLGVNSSIRGRLKSHRRKKGRLWSHCSLFEVHDNVTPDELRELEGLFRHIYRHDAKANRLNKQKGFKRLRSVRAVLFRSKPQRGQTES
jgi:hypothetical protein